MTTTHLSRPRPLPVVQPTAAPVVLLAAGGATVLAGEPAWSVLPVGALLLWGVREAGHESADRRVRGHATTLVALAFVLAVSMPVVLSPVVDQLVLAGLVATALVAVVVASPSVRAALRPRPLELGDLAWWVLPSYAALAIFSASRPVVLPDSDRERAAIAALVLLVPLLHEVLLRGLLMHASATFVRGVVPAALAQGVVAAALFGRSGLVIGIVLGLVLGAIRLHGGWQASLYAHWGLALGLAVPLLWGEVR